MDPSSNQNPESFPTENQEENELNQIDNHEGVEPIYVMTLELEQGKAEQIKIFSDSEPSELAYAFCKEHDLDYNAHEYLTEKIEVLLNQYKNNAEDNSQIEEVEDEHGLTESNNNSNNNLNEKKGKFVYRTYDVEDDNNEKNVNVNNIVGNDENSLRYSENSSLRNQKNKNFERNKKFNQDDEIVISNNSERKVINDNKRDNLIQIDNNEIEIDNKIENKNNKNKKEKYNINEIENDNENNYENNINEIENENENNYENNINEIENDNENNYENNNINEIENNNENEKYYVNEENIENQDENINNDLEEVDIDNMNENKNDIKEDFIATSSNNLVSENSNSSPNKTENIHSEINNFLIKNKNDIKEKPDIKNIINKNQISSNHNNNTNTSSSNKNNNSNPIKVKKNNNLSENENIKVKQKQNKQKQKSNDFIPLSTKKHISNINNPNQNMTTNSSFSVQMNILNKCPSNYSKISGGSIFDRLFMDSEMRRLVPKKPCHFGYRNEKENENNENDINNKLYKTQPTSANRKKEKLIIQDENGNNVNYGEYMYNRDKDIRKNHLEEMEEIKKKIEDEEVEKCSFRPKVNTEFNNRLNDNQTSMPLSYKRQLSKSKLERLEKEYNQKYPFKPSINDNYKTDLSFNERQQFFSNLYKQRHKELCNLINNNKEDENGKPMFRPTLVSKPLNSFNKNYNNLDVYTRNYTIAKQEEDKRDTLYNKYYRNKKENPIPVQNSKRQNKKIIDKIHKSVFDTIFKELDSDQDGLISPIHINTEKLPNQIITIIEPLINELKDDNQTLSNEDFLNAMNSLYNDLTIVDKHTLINTYRNTAKRSNSLSNKNNATINSKMNLQNKSKISNKNVNSLDNKRKIDVNTERLANNHDKRIEQMFDNYMRIYNNKDYNNIYFDNNYNNQHTVQSSNLNKSEYFNNRNNNTSIRDNNNSEFSSICNFTFDNYMKSLN